MKSILHDLPTFTLQVIIYFVR